MQVLMVAPPGGYVLDGIPRNMEQARAAYEIGLELGMTADVALHLQADDAELTRRLLARAAHEVGREILAAPEALRPSLDRAPWPERLRPDLTGLGEAFGATGSVGGKSE